METDKWSSHEQSIAWLKARQAGIGGSDIAALLGLDRYKSAWNIYLAKVEEPDPHPPSEAALWGTLVQPVVGNEWARRENVDIMEPPPLSGIPDHPLCIGNPDYLTVEDPTRVLEVKLVDSYAHREDWEDGTRVPARVLCQANWYMAITGSSSAAVACLVSGRRLESYTVLRDDVAIGEMIETAERFWADHVVPRKPPDPDGSYATGKALEARYETPVERATVILPADAQAHLKAYREALAISRQYAELAYEHGNWLRQVMGELGGTDGTFPGRDKPSVTWRPRHALNEQALAAALTPDELRSFGKWHVDRALVEKAKGTAFVKQYMEPKGSRTLLVKDDGEEPF